ncbi:MAG: metQ [Gammaproteobacteria bacterium]|jgi:D-methionine transport system substrate-binding protein|nr:metQ [Gammaproteobacteria bacterium]
MHLKRTLSLLFFAVTLSAVTACNQHKSSASSENQINVGTISGPETVLMEEAKTVAAENGLQVNIVTFTDYAMPNEALSDGSIDANMFQHEPYLEQSIATNGYDIVAIGKTFVYPMGVYSSKIKQLSELKAGSIFAIPRDPSNQGRALLLLQRAGLVTLKQGSGTDATVLDIIDNPKKLVFKELDAAQLPKVLPDVDAAAINTNYAMLANLTPSRDAILVEHSDSPYANLVVVRKKDKDDPKFQKLLDALHSDAVMKKATALFNGQAVPAWK